MQARICERTTLSTYWPPRSNHVAAAFSSYFNGPVSQLAIRAATPACGARTRPLVEGLAADAFGPLGPASSAPEPLSLCWPLRAGLREPSTRPCLTRSRSRRRWGLCCTELEHLSIRLAHPKSHANTATPAEVRITQQRQSYLTSHYGSRRETPSSRR